MRPLSQSPTLLLLLATLLLAACGFQLRGAYALPFDSLYINQPETSELHAQIKRSVTAASHAHVVGTQQEAQASLLILNDQQAKNILSLSAAGRAREYELVRTVSFRVVDANMRDWLPPGRIVIRRDITYSDDLVLSKEAEEALLWRDIQADLVQQLLRRMSSAKAPPPSVAP